MPSDSLPKVLNFVSANPPTSKYLHWNKLIRYPPPSGLTHEEWWFGLKLSRNPLYKDIPLQDKSGQPFKFLVTDPIPERLHHIDLGAGGRIGVPEPVTNPETRDQYYVSSLIEEAITSSQLEGATTTREVAKEMIRTGRAPRDHSERMILNNFSTMRQMSEMKDRPLTQELICELHRMVTAVPTPSMTIFTGAPDSGLQVTPRCVAEFCTVYIRDIRPQNSRRDDAVCLCKFADVA